MQTIILYIVIGPGETYDHKVPVDLRHLVYDDSWSRLLYLALLATSVVSVGISFSKVGLVPWICIHPFINASLFLSCWCQDPSLWSPTLSHYSF